MPSAREVIRVAEMTGRTAVDTITLDRAARYRRAFTLSRELDAGAIDAQLKDGVLRLRIPKVAEAQPRRIEVRAA